MIISEVIIVSFLVMCCVSLLAVQLDDSIIEKDLYDVLGIASHATLADVKKSFRKLAQKYHPDKAKPGSTHESGMKFQEISEAYDILSSRELREEYDSRRFQKTFMRQDDKQYSTLDDNTLYYESEFYIPHDFMQYPDEYYFNAASVVGSVLHRGQVMFPYDEILTSRTGSYFALLDGSCSLVVYQGDVHGFAANVQHIHNVYMDPFSTGTGRGTRSPYKQQQQYKELYRSEQFDYLQGRCAAVLDYYGVFHICVRDPFGGLGESLWSSAAASSWDQTVVDSSPYNTDYIMQLRDDGALEIASIYQPPSPWEHLQYQCIWSTVSCNQHMATAKHLLFTLQSSLKRVFSMQSITRIKRIINETLEVMKKLVVDIVYKIKIWLLQQQQFRFGRSSTSSKKGSSSTPLADSKHRQQQKEDRNRRKRERVR